MPLLEFEDDKEAARSVAIVGSGLAGLTSAYLLKRGGYDVEVFEMGKKPSLDGASITVRTSRDEFTTTRVDIPMRAISGGYYSSVMALYKYLGLTFKSQEFLFSFSWTEGNGESYESTKRVNPSAYFIHSSNNHRFPPLKPAGVSWWRYIVEVLYLFFAYSYFTFCCFWFPPHTRDFSGSQIPAGRTESLREYLHRIKVPQYFVDSYLLPLMSSVTTCPHANLLDFPASDMAGYKARTHKRPHYMVEGGVGRVERKLLEGVNIGLGRTVLLVQKIEDGKILVRWEEWDLVNPGQKLTFENTFDQVVLAVSPMVVAKIYRKLQKQMSKIPCCETEVIAHYDERVIEAFLGRKGAGRELLDEQSYNAGEKVCEEANGLKFPSVRLEKLSTNNGLLGEATAHIIQLRTTIVPSDIKLNNDDTPWRLFNGTSSCTRTTSRVTESTHLHPPRILLTTSTCTRLDQSKVIGESRFIRVLRTPESRDVVECIFRPKDMIVPSGYQDKSEEGCLAGSEQEWRNGDEGVWLTGGWCWDGMVLLEGCVRSAMKVAKGLGCEIPWEAEVGEY